MSTIVKTEAIVLKSIDFKESSKIVTFYTGQFGKLVGMVKGARRPKSKFSASLQPMSYVSIIVYKKEGREIQTISQCDLIKSFRNLYEDIEKMSVGISIIELVNLVTPEHAENRQLFHLLVNSLNALNDAIQNPLNLLFYFEIHLARVLGFQPVFDRCISCKKELRRIKEGTVYKFNIEKGGLACTQCSRKLSNPILLPAAVLTILHKILLSNQIEFVFDLEIKPEVRRILENFNWAYLRYHLPGIQILKSRGVFSKILGKI